jgi:tetratricopeptide (TPR) repeat protein
MCLTKRGIFSLVFFAFVTLMLGCQSSNTVQLDSQSIIFDKGFPGFDKIQIEDKKDIFHLDDEAKLFVHQSVGAAGEPLEQIKALVYALFDQSQFNLLYDGNANTVAAETFKRKAANCLSLSIMTYALAEEAGFNAQFQDIDIPEYWTRNQGYSVLNGHINLRLAPKADATVFTARGKGYQVDFDPLASRSHFKKRVVSKSIVIAMYYNNKGADALINYRFDEAYAYFRQALIIEDSFESTAVNLGLLYRLTGHFDQAEASYNYVLERNPNNLTAWENLAYLYLVTERVELAQKILADVEGKRANNPYYYVSLGEHELELGNYLTALSHFKKALTLDKKRHEIYFGLARVYLQLGEKDMAQHYLELAKDFSSNQQDELRYQSKLDFLTSL